MFYPDSFPVCQESVGHADAFANAFANANLMLLVLSCNETLVESRITWAHMYSVITILMHAVVWWPEIVP